MKELLDVEACRKSIADAARSRYRGRVDIVSGVIVEAAGIPAAMGELCRIDRGSAGPIEAEVVGFRGARTLLMPHGDVEGIAPRQEVTALGRPFTIGVGQSLMGRIIDGFGRPVDGHGRLVDGRGRPGSALERRRVHADSPNPLERRPITAPLQTGVRAIDGLATLGRGQRLGIFSGSGVGKSTLLGQIARGTDAEVVVVGLIGERGRDRWRSYSSSRPWRRPAATPSTCRRPRRNWCPVTTWNTRPCPLPSFSWASTPS